MQPSFETYRCDLLAQGFDEVIQREWAPLQIVAEHAHPFAAKAVVVQGEMWLTVGGAHRHLSVGSGFELEPNVVHSERYGAEGATYWVGRRSAGLPVQPAPASVATSTSTSTSTSTPT